LPDAIAAADPFVDLRTRDLEAARREPEGQHVGVKPRAVDTIGGAGMVRCMRTTASSAVIGRSRT
jgi:hypothetical protein